MLSITLGEEFFDNDKEEFIFALDRVVMLEHSLAALSKWESRFGKPFLSTEEKTGEEVLYYMQCMVTSTNLPDEDLHLLTQEHLALIQDYIGSNQSATTFSETREQKARGRKEIVTSELIYYWMVSYNIPLDFQYVHLNRLFALLRICSLKQQKEQKMSPKATAEQNRQLNAERRAAANSKG